MSETLQQLARYGAARIEVFFHGGDVRREEAPGGSLSERVEVLGTGELAKVLGDPAIARVELSDGALKVTAARSATDAVLQVAWDGKIVVEEALPLPGVVGFLPEAGSRVGSEGALLLDTPLYAVREGGGTALYRAGRFGPGGATLLGVVPPARPEDLGSPAFRARHGVRWAYVAGAMAGGIASEELVLALAKQGLLAFFGSGGLPLPRVEAAVKRLVAEASGLPYGFNLLHNPAEPAVEEGTVDLYLAHGVRRIEASAYMNLSPAVVRFRVTGIHALPDGRIVAPNQVFAKVSRAEVAERFLRPPPPAILAELVQRGVIDATQAELAAKLPVAEDVTVEGDSGGHTDHRPTFVLLPEMLGLRDKIAAEQGYAARGAVPRIGAAGGLGTPASLYAAFAAGADYVLTGSVNQATNEAGTSALAKEMLGEAGYADVATGPAPDMFELGAHVQVLGRGSMYAQRAQRLYELYKAYDGIDAIPSDERKKIEKQIFQSSLEKVWEGTRAYWAERDPEQVARAKREPRHKMALTFRWYLGMTSRWARTGDVERKRDFQIWCGPAMGAFNTFVKGSALAPVSARGVAQVAEVLMVGAAAHARQVYARALGAEVVVGALPPLRADGRGGAVVLG